MALTIQQENELLQMNQAFKAGVSVAQLPDAVAETLSGAYVEVVKDGVSYRATPEALAASIPVDGVYPDVPVNRVTIKRKAQQLSSLWVEEDNTALKNNIQALCKPVLVNRSGLIDTYLSGIDIRKNTNGYPVNLTSWDKPVMGQMGGFWKKYVYDASTNTEHIRVSPYKVKGYTYVRRRFISLFNGNTVTNSSDGSSKTFLCSNYDVYTTQSISVSNAHTYAKNLGSNFRAMADQDHELYTILWWLLKGTTHTQGVYEGITNVDYTRWGAYAAPGGQSSYGQFHKNGITASIASHEGEVSHVVSDFTNGAITVKPNKFLWRENGLAGPYYLFMSGRLIIGNVVWQVKDLSKIAFTKTNDYEEMCSLVGIAPATNGWQRILDTYQDTIMPAAIGGSDTTGMCDQWYGLASPDSSTVYVPARVGDADGGAHCGLVLLSSNRGPANANAIFGVSLACEDQTDLIPEGTVA